MSCEEMHDFREALHKPLTYGFHPKESDNWNEN